MRVVTNVGPENTMDAVVSGAVSAQTTDRDSGRRSRVVVALSNENKAIRCLTGILRSLTHLGFLPICLTRLRRARPATGPLFLHIGTRELGDPCPRPGVPACAPSDGPCGGAGLPGVPSNFATLAGLPNGLAPVVCPSERGRYFPQRFGAKIRNLRRTVEGFSMGDARCNCGAITLSLPEEPSKIVVACHCIDCQRRTGAPFGVGAYYSAGVVTISGTSKVFTHDAASGGKMHNYFCPQCGSTVYWKVTNLPAMIGVAVGAMADPKYPAPVISVFEQSKHDWVQIGGAVERFQQSYLPKNSN